MILMRYHQPPSTTAFSVVAVLLLLAGCGTTANPEWQELEWPELETELQQRFPDVPFMSTEELEQQLLDNRDLILLDAREPREYAVSHLKGARLASSEGEALAWLEERSPAKQIVVYCSVGYRSARLVRRLHALGYPQAVNLQGSIFAWANQGRPVYRAQEQVETVHPYNREWGRFLKRELWAFAPTN